MPTLVDVDGGRFGVQAYVTGAAFTLDSPDDGTLDRGNVLGPIEDGWIDIVCDVTTANWAQGASQDAGVFTRYEAGVAEVELSNVDGRYTPDTAPYYGRLSIGTSIRVWVGAGAVPDAVVFTGTVESVVARGYLEVPVVVLTVTDGVVDLNAYDPAPFDPPVGAGETAEARVHRILDEASWTAPRDVPAGGPTMAGLTFGSSAWTELRDVLTAARWQAYIDGDGTFRAALYPFDQDPDITATWGCDAGQGVVVDLEVAHDVTQLRNIVDAARDDPDAVTFTHQSGVSVAKFGPHRESFTLGLDDDGDVDEWARWVMLNSAVPQPRISVMAVAPGVDPTGVTWELLAAARLGDVWQVLFPDLDVDVTSWVRGWRHTVRADPASWETLVVLSTGALGQDRPGWWTLDHDVWGVLDAGNRLKIV
jgi:hypothetical protein